MIRVLSIDGGGIRGIIPAMVLAEIERRTGRRIAQLFDVIAGTSTGGILALGLTKPGPAGAPSYTAQAMVDLYAAEGQRIFSRSRWHRMCALGNLIDEKYPARGIEMVLDRYFGAARLKDALTDVLITSYEIERRTAWFFRSSRARLRADHDFPMKQVARATSAAPTYFEPVKIASAAGDDYFALIDGGVFANNPALCGYVEARSTFPEAEDFLVVSLGTGEMTRSLPYDEVKGWGLVRWAQPILNVVFDGVNDTTDYQLRQLLHPGPDGRRSYYRFQTRLEAGSDDMDRADHAHVRVLQLLGEDVIRQYTDDLDRLCEQLTTDRPQSQRRPQAPATPRHLSIPAPTR